MTAEEFEKYARKIMSNKFGVDLPKGKMDGVPKEWDMASGDGSVVGDAKFLSMVGGKKYPPAKIDMISAHVWLLEHVQAKTRFLVFGNQREVPRVWQEKHGHMLSGVEFYFLDPNGNLEQLRVSRQ